MPTAVEGATTGIVFETYIEKVLVPSLRRGQVMVMDNLSAHEGERVRELAESAGCELLYLPPRTPRRTSVPSKRPSRGPRLFFAMRARSREAPVEEAIGKALDPVTSPRRKRLL